MMGKLTMLAVTKAKKKGLHGDGDNLYLQVGDNGNKSWLFRYMIDGRARKMGLGALNAMTLAEARDSAAGCRKLVNLGIDPLSARKDDRKKARLTEARGISFEKCARAYIDAHKDGWRNPKHIQQWENTLAVYTYPLIGALPVSDIDVALVMKVLEQKNKAYPKGETLWKARSKRPAVCAVALKPFLIGPLSGNIAAVKIRRGGAENSTSYCPSAQKSKEPSTIRHCLTVKSMSLWPC
jgi:hypothetical protein